MSRRSRSTTAGLAVLVACLAAGLAGCASELERLLPERPGTSVLVISFDALRADHLGLYGYELDISPALDAFAGEAVVFESARVGGQATPTSFASAFTGRYPHRVFRGWKLEAERTLAEWLGDNGYRTGALLNNMQLTAERHFDRGFDDYRTLRGDDEEKLTDLAIEWLDEHGDEPFFLWVHYISPHSPYRHREVAEHLYDPSYDGPFQRASRPRHTPEDPADRQRYRELYDGEILAADGRFGRLVEAAREAGLLERTVVVVTADHGEEMAERGLFGHKTLYEEVWRVPLLVRHPDGRPGRVDTPYSNVDLLPTLAAILDLEPPPGLDGMDVRRPERSQRPSYGLAMTNRKRRAAAVLVGAEKLLVQCGVELGERVQLFDLAVDPSESTDLSHSREDRVEELFARLKAELGGPPCVAIDRATRGVDPIADLDEATTRELEALGYVE